MGLEEKLRKLQHLPSDRSPPKKEMALFLLNTHYSLLYGTAIRYESVRSMRNKIHELETHLGRLRHSSPLLFRLMVRQCTDFERICELLVIAA